MALEMRVATPEENWIKQGIQRNNEELRQAIASKMQDYVGLQYTEETIKEAKKDKAALNKLREALESERKRVKKQCLMPYEKFEKQVKEIVQIIDEPISLIDAQIKEVEEQRRIEKKGKVLEICENNVGTLKGILPFEKVFKTEYLNVSKTLKSITEEITTIIEKVNRDMDTIEELNSNYEVQVKDMYIRTFDLSLALHENNRLLELERKAEERKKQAEQKRREEEQKKEQEENRKQECQQSIQNQQIQAQNLKSKQTEGIETVAEQEYTIDFRVIGTKYQLNLLKDFLQSNEISYGPVPK